MLTHRGSIVSFRERVETDDEFDTKLHQAHHVLGHFKSNGGSVWGCDGAGYTIQKSHLLVEVHKSGIGPINFKKGEAAAKQCGCFK
jgi:hypothetical protein